MSTSPPSVQFDTIGSWEADNVSAGQVERALSDLRGHEERAAVRTSVLTLVIVVGSKEEADEQLDVVRHLGARHPSRTLVLVLEDEGQGESHLDASVAVCVVDRGGRQVAVEEVVIDVRGQARFHLDSLVLPFTLPDLPVAVWLPTRILDRGDPLLEAANRVVVDTRVVGYKPDALVLRIQPDEGITLRFGAKVPGQAFRVRSVSMDFFYGAAFMEETPDAYERLLLDALMGDATLFIRSDEVQRAWHIVDPLLQSWENDDVALAKYEAGTWGPTEADELMEADGRRWRRP